MSSPSTPEILGTLCFALAVLHTFSVKLVLKLASKFREGSVAENVLHLLGEVEVVFGVWAGVLFGLLALLEGGGLAIQYIDRSDFTEPLFVFAIMSIAATRPILELAQSAILGVSRLAPASLQGVAFYVAALTLGPLLGSFITEPAAMTVTALVLREMLFRRGISEQLSYLTLGVLFVNVSIGGVLTPFAAPPVLMVSHAWNWDLPFMLTVFGWKAAIAVFLNSCLAAWLGRRELARPFDREVSARGVPAWVSGVHLVALGAVVLNSHHPAVFIGLLLFFLGFATASREYQDEIQLRQSLLVAFFLAGLVVLGQFQNWWLQPLMSGMNATALFLGSTALTAITDNAALTYLGSHVLGQDPSAFGLRYALVAGAVAGGGLTVIANAPNPAGYSILQESFGEGGISPGRLLIAALVPTAIAMACLWFL